MKTLLVGLGNPIVSDDGVGVRLARHLGSRLLEVPDLEVVEECSVGGLNLLHVLAGYERAILLDCIQTKGGAPGTWYRFDASALRETAHLSNAHDVNLATALEVGRRLGMALPEPREIHVFAVEAQDCLTLSEGLTPALEQAFPAYSESILSAILELLPGTGTSGRTARGGG
jgi:hydrogenase maturation protease